MKIKSILRVIRKYYRGLGRLIREKIRARQLSRDDSEKSRSTRMIKLLVVFCIALIFYISVWHNTTWSKPVLPTSGMSEVCIEDSEITKQAYDNYWRFIPMSYIIVGENRATCRLYKISSKVKRHDYDVDKFTTGEDGYVRYKGDGYKSKVGVDLSRYQGEIDWNAVSETKISFAMLRLGYRGYTEGTLETDKYFFSYAEHAKEKGIDIGVYFFTQAINYDEGAAEAQFVIDKLQANGIDVAYPIVIDTEEMEVEEARANAISIKDRTEALVGFCDTIKAAGYTPMIYASRNWFAERLDMDKLGDYELWLAQYSEKPDFPYDFRCWQYTNAGSVPGITGDVDLNVWISQKESQKK